MGFVHDIIAKARAARQHKVDIATYKAALMEAVGDGAITVEELQHLDELQRHFGLTREELSQFRVAAYLSAFNAAKADGEISEAEEGELSKIKAFLGMPEADITGTEVELNRFRLLREISEGHLPTATVNGLITQRGEIPYWAEPAALLEERVVNRQYVGGYQGVSFRIMKGVSYRVGTQRGHLVSQTGIVPVSTGTFIITSKRVIFVGNKKGFNVRLEKLLNLELHSDGVRVTDGSGKPRAVAFATPGNSELVGAILTYAVNHVVA